MGLSTRAPERAAALRLVVIAGIGMCRQLRLVYERLQIVVLVGVCREWWIEGQGIEGLGVLDTTVDLGCHVVIRDDYESATLDVKHPHAQVGDTCFLS